MDIHQLLTDLNNVLSEMEDDPERARESLENIINELTIIAMRIKAD